MKLLVFCVLVEYYGFSFGGITYLQLIAIFIFIFRF